jgi:hypothetical protein
LRIVDVEPQLVLIERAEGFALGVEPAPRRHT